MQMENISILDTHCWIFSLELFLLARAIVSNAHILKIRWMMMMMMMMMMINSPLEVFTVLLTSAGK